MNTAPENSFPKHSLVLGCVCALALISAGCKSGGSAADLRVELTKTNMKVLDLEAAQTETLKKLQYNMDELQRLVENQRKTAEDNNTNLQTQLDELRKTVAKNAAGATANPGAAGQPFASTPDDPTATEVQERLFKEATTLYSLGKYNEAIDLYTSFLFDYRDSPKAPNAAYELGRCYYASNDFEKARRAFQHVLETYPTSAIIPDSMISLVMCQLNQTKYKEARETLKVLQTRYPDYNPDIIKTIQSKLPPA